MNQSVIAEILDHAEQRKQAAMPRTIEELKPGTMVTATDTNGHEYTVMFNILQNSGTGDGVLMEVSLTRASMPRILAFGEVRCKPVENSARPTWMFLSYSRMNPVLRGTPVDDNPRREGLMLTRP